ncbi:ribosomal RNA large subunit methyltransferase I [Methanobrevibacter cuticularis]|uniref:Ribosomal RNA large subunit methyltransferase I n=1 Tax=Methanobrevibacter cuticularis TaxID=47311 RepID=A0A166DFW1_9EURY|nr:class I SAM-dependent methyltransferase family protein [Methanobrevibacter cuticularis]KZX15560.1 ribosomal RNA large subunit methyltransferase I [Methanobrevibacter cuticularis]
MLAIKIPLKETNKLRIILMEKEIIDMNYKIQSSDSYGYIPINRKIDNDVIIELENELKKKLKGQNEEKIAIEVVEKNLEKIKKYPKSIAENLEGKLSNDEIEELKTSFDIIGDVVILEIPEKLQKHKDIIGHAALDFTKRKGVFMKKSAIEGITRIRQIENIAGENETRTIHKEHGARFSLDVKDVYFSPRLATERKRIASQVKDKEMVLDMFAGIGPFPILIAKRRDVEIYAVDINKSAILHMKENIHLNKLKGKIHPIHGDITQIAKNFKEKNMKFDRIIMNLPGTAYEFLDLAILLMNNNGILHYYEFAENYDQGIERISKSALKYDKQLEILGSRKVKSSSPGQWHICIDAKISDF